MIDFLNAILDALRALANPHWVDPVSGRMRVVLDAAGGSQNLNNVASLTTMSQVGAIPANSVVFDAMTNCWANTVRRAIA